MRHYLSLLWAYTGQYLKSRLEYRADFLTSMLMELAQQLVLLAVVLVVFDHVPAMKGWTRDELLFMFGYFLIPSALYHAISGQFWDFGERYIVKGEMDRVLTRPAHSLLQLLLEGIELEPLIGLVSGGVLMAWCGHSAGVNWRWWDALILAVGVLGSLGVYLGIYVSVNTIAFFSDSKNQLEPMIFNINRHYGRYPTDFYNRPLRFLLTCILPFAFVGYYPSAYFLRRGPGWLAWALLTPVVGLLCLSAALWLWRKGITRYQGAGS